MYKKFVDIAPFIMLVFTGVTGLCSSFDWYLKVFDYLPDLIGYSILTNLVMLRVYMAKRYCHTTRFAVYGLITMNIISLFKNTIYYTPLYDPIITLIILAVVYYLRKKDGIRNVTS